MMQQSDSTQTHSPSPQDTHRSAWLERLPSRKDHLIFWPVFVIGLAADLWSKAFIFNYLSRHGTITFFNGVLRLVRVLNDGAAFGIFAGRAFLLSGASIIAIMIVLGLFLFGQVRHKMIVFALGLFAAGICGNLYDRLFNDGRVRDFIDVMYWPSKHWPAFNIADSLLCIGVGIMILTSLFATERPDQEPAHAQK